MSTSIRASATLPIRRVIRGTEYNRKPFNPQTYPVSPSIENLLSQPTWSVRSLLPPSRSSRINTSSTAAEPPSTTTKAEKEITREKLHHLLKLSALPIPKSEQEEAKMLQTLRDQIHFVKTIQSVDTTGVESLITIRDETTEAIEEETITLEKMKPYLDLEDKVGPNGTIRRRAIVRTKEEEKNERATWEIDVGDLGNGSDRRRRGRFFFVKKAKDKKEAGSGAAKSNKDAVNETKAAT